VLSYFFWRGIPDILKLWDTQSLGQNFALNPNMQEFFAGKISNIFKIHSNATIFLAARHPAPLG